MRLLKFGLGDNYYTDRKEKWDKLYIKKESPNTYEDIDTTITNYLKPTQWNKIYKGVFVSRLHDFSVGVINNFIFIFTYF